MNVDLNEMDTKSDDITGKVAIITGGASGFGKELSYRLAKLGAQIIVADINDPNEVVKEIIRQGGYAIGVKCDVTSTADISNLFEQAQKLGGCDVLVNNAGIGGDPRTGESGFYLGPQEGSKWKKIMDINLTAPIELTQFCLQQMRAHRRGGVILNVASMAAIVPMQQSPVYCATKSGLLHFSKSLFDLYRTDNIRVVTICPSFADTPLIQDVKEKMSRITGGILSVDEVVTGMVDLVLDKEKRGTGAVMTVTLNRGREFPLKFNPRNSKL